MVWLCTKNISAQADLRWCFVLALLTSHHQQRVRLHQPTPTNAGVSLLPPLSPLCDFRKSKTSEARKQMSRTTNTNMKTLQFSSVTQSCLTLCNLMNHSMPGLPVHHQLPESTQTHVHRVGDAIQPSHPLSSPSPAPNPSQH